jgi:DNA-binding response OmpR family regulator
MGISTTNLDGRLQASKTVLLVENESASGTKTSMILRKAGFDVITASKVADAVSVFEKHYPKIGFLITDIALPDGNGCSLAIMLRDRRPGLRLLFVSFDVGLEACKYYGVEVPSLYVLKRPFSTRQLLSRVRNILGTAEAITLDHSARTFTASGGRVE